MTQALAAEMSVTVDDFNFRVDPLLGPRAKNERILSALSKHGIKAAGFVTGRHVVQERHKRELRRWQKAGHMIANHTYSHKNFHKETVEAFSRDILRADKMLRDYPAYRKFFRFPMLNGGNERKKRDRIRAFLRKQGYRNGYVTIDTSDWYINDRLVKKLKRNRKAKVGPYREYYLKHLWENAQYYDKLSKVAIGRSVRHTLLIHHNLLNALFLDDALKMFRAKGWKLINAYDAFKDPVFNEYPDVVPAGESIIWAIAKERGVTTKSHPAEGAHREAKKMLRLGL